MPNRPVVLPDGSKLDVDDPSVWREWVHRVAGVAHDVGVDDHDLSVWVHEAAATDRANPPPEAPAVFVSRRLPHLAHAGPAAQDASLKPDCLLAAPLGLACFVFATAYSAHQAPALRALLFLGLAWCVVRALCTRALAAGFVCSRRALTAAVVLLVGMLGGGFIAGASHHLALTVLGGGAIGCAFLAEILWPVMASKQAWYVGEVRRSLVESQRADFARVRALLRDEQPTMLDAMAQDIHPSVCARELQPTRSRRGPLAFAGWVAFALLAVSVVAGTYLAPR